MKAIDKRLARIESAARPSGPIMTIGAKIIDPDTGQVWRIAPPVPQPAKIDYRLAFRHESD